MIKYDIVKHKLDLEFHEVQFTHRLMCLKVQIYTHDWMNNMIVNYKSIRLLSQYIDDTLNSVRTIISQSVERKYK